MMLLLPTLSAHPAAAQSDTVPSGSITGQVFDGRPLDGPGGEDVVVPTDLRPVPRATVQLLGTNLTAQSSENGEFSFSDVPAGDPYKKYVVRVQAKDFGSWVEHGVVIRPRGETRLYAELHTRTTSDTFTPPEERAASTRASASAGKAGQYRAASTCSGYSSDTMPPPRIKVYRRSAGVITTYDFRFYAKHVLPSEWIPSWPVESLRAGAMAVKTYGWNWVNNWRGGSFGGTCYDVDDTTSYQVFNPNVSNTSTDQAVDDTYSWYMQKNGHIFSSEYRANLTGSNGEACGAGADGTKMSQWGSKNCADAGKTWPEIVNTYYYPGITLGQTTSTAMAAVQPSGDGYWILRSNGGVDPIPEDSEDPPPTHYGDLSASSLNAPVVGIAAPSTGGGYWIVANDGGAFTFGSLTFWGSMSGQPLNAGIVAMAPTPGGQGYWLVGADGGIFTFGNAGFYGSVPPIDPNRRDIRAIAPAADGLGYWLVGADGAVFSFGSAAYYGGANDGRPHTPVAGIAATRPASGPGNGYWLLDDSGAVFPFGDAQALGNGPSANYYSGIVAKQGLHKGYRLIRSDEFSPKFEPNQVPFGFIDEDSPIRVAGWALDPNQTTHSVNIQIVVDNVVRYDQPTSILRSDVNNAYGGISGSHGFDWPVPADLRNGLAHTVKVYAVDSQGGPSTELNSVTWTQFADDWTGVDNAGWNTSKWVTTSNDSTKKADVQGNQGRLYVNGSPARGTAQMTAVANTEALVTYRFNERTPGSFLRLFMRASAATGSNQMPNAYRVEVSSDSSTSTIKLQKFVNSTVTQIGSFTYPTPPAVPDTTPQRLRFRVQGSTIQAKVWPASGVEPAGWSVTATDNAITGPGVLQIAHSHSSGTHTVYLDDLTLTPL